MVRVPLPLHLSQRKNLPFGRDAFSLARHKGLTQPLRVCRPSAPFHSASDTLPLEGPQDLLPFAAALSGSSPSAPTLISKKKSPLSERCFFFGAPQGTRTPNLRGRKSHAFPTFLGLIVCFLQLFYNLLYLCMNLYIMVESGGKSALLCVCLSIIRQVFPFLPSP